ncbi:DoxX family protein [uncultured Desulfobacterium sp.]|uniref:DoxX family protein n=1 Tax=uncultured Desulfobacterium sp. TaxID=201089 RepID=A0A445MU97_9BACT|nr:DoxX family protein [uncultured Desulfobacterium sp.]
MIRMLLKTENSPSLLVVRLALAIVIFPHGTQKVLGWFGGSGFTATIHQFSAMGFPAWSVILLMTTEFLGALLLVLGFLSRLWALATGISISICMSLYHIQNGFFMNWFGLQKGEGFEYHILVLGICLALVIGGGGMFSLDQRLADRQDNLNKL